MASSAAKSPADTFFAAQAGIWEARYESRTYRERRQLIRELVLAEVARLGLPTSEIDVLDFGCGGGVLLRDLAELGLSVTGVDTSREMIDKARSYLGDGAERVDLELTDSSGEGNYLQRSYDIVVCTSVLEFLPEIEPVAARLAAVVRKGGTLIVSVPNRQSWLRKIERITYEHPRAFRRLPMFSDVARKSWYLDFQRHQFALAELTETFQRFGLVRQQHRFHVVPRFLRVFEDSAVIGMMLTAVFRKNARSLIAEAERVRS
jgi:2-polyprenyl-6-hydroxyphenyl methylase/3-demethylubiquinone-9 3-methyltransferase